MPNQGANQLNITLDALKKEAFKEWCKHRNVSVAKAISNMIDSCLDGKPEGEFKVFPTLENLEKRVEHLEERLNLHP